MDLSPFTVTTVPCDSDVTVTATGPLIHLCPFREEEDLGRVEIIWRCTGATFELHSLAEYLGGWEQTEISHEELTDRLRHHLSTYADLELLSVVTTWSTAGIEVRCSTSPTPAARTP